jgi:hypothetical protein
MDINTLGQIFSHIPGNVYKYVGTAVSGNVNAEVTGKFALAANDSSVVTNVVDCGARGIFIHHNSDQTVTSDDFVLYGRVEEVVAEVVEEQPAESGDGE